MKKSFIKSSVFLLVLFTFSSCHKIAGVFYNPDMCRSEKKRKGKFKQEDKDRRAKSGQY